MNINRVDYFDENPLFTDQVRNAVAKLRENRTRSTDLSAKPVLHTWAQQVAWERLRYEWLLQEVWTYVIESNDVGGLDTDDLIDRLDRIGATCPAALDTDAGASCDCTRGIHPHVFRPCPYCDCTEGA